MDYSSKDSPLADEACFFEGTHSRMRRFTTLTFGMPHLVLCKVMRLANMEFWIQQNSIMSEIKGSEYKFNPPTFMVDQSVANSDSIEAVYGVEISSKNPNLPMALPS